MSDVEMLGVPLTSDASQAHCCSAPAVTQRCCFLPCESTQGLPPLSSAPSSETVWRRNADGAHRSPPLIAATKAFLLGIRMALDNRSAFSLSCSPPSPPPYPAPPPLVPDGKTVCARP
mmetsp:Transcript_64221/g.106225  ORF Transcript_64221/g.106225 Transcript_64221/m.106225 type:complete len:118 (-) Transcript_64221:117-470(-)